MRLASDFDVGRLLESNLIHDFFQDVPEARHMHAHLGGVQVGEQINLGVEEMLIPATRNADDAVEVGHPRPAEANVDLGRGLLDIAAKGEAQTARMELHLTLVHLL